MRKLNQFMGKLFFWIGLLLGIPTVLIWLMALEFTPNNKIEEIFTSK